MRGDTRIINGHKVHSTAAVPNAGPVMKDFRNIIPKKSVSTDRSRLNDCRPAGPETPTHSPNTKEGAAVT